MTSGDWWKLLRFLLLAVKLEGVPGVVSGFPPTIFGSGDPFSSKEIW